jgi:hypothetical protein
MDALRPTGVDFCSGSCVTSTHGRRGCGTRIGDGQQRAGRNERYCDDNARWAGTWPSCRLSLRKDVSHCVGQCSDRAQATQLEFMANRYLERAEELEHATQLLVPTLRTCTGEKLALCGS